MFGYWNLFGYCVLVIGYFLIECLVILLMPMMPGFGDLGKTLIFLGCAIILLGVVLLVSGKPVRQWFGFQYSQSHKIPFLGKLPGDIYISRKNLTFYFPFVTCIVLSLILSFIARLWSKK